MLFRVVYFGHLILTQIIFDVVLPSLKLASSKRKNGVTAAPNVGVAKLLQEPLILLYFSD